MRTIIQGFIHVVFCLGFATLIFFLAVIATSCKNNPNAQHSSSDVEAAAANAKADSTNSLSKDSVANKPALDPNQ